MLSFVSPSGHEDVATCPSKTRPGERWMKIRVTNTIGREPALFPFLLSVTAFKSRASSSFQLHHDKKSNDYRLWYCKRASIVATDADKRWEEYNPLARLQIHRPTMCLNVFCLPLPLSSSLRNSFEYLAVRTKCEDSSRSRKISCFYLFPRFLQRPAVRLR